MTDTTKYPVANFIVAGATRSGTTTLWYYLCQHPEVFVPKQKELWFFNIDQNYQKGMTGYSGMFRNWSGQKAIGDITPMYLTTGLLYRENRKYSYLSKSDSAIHRIAETIPDARIILTLRNPVTRLISQYQKNYYQGKKNVLRSLEEHLDRDIKEQGPPSANFVFANRYACHLAHLLEHFRREQIYIMIFEEWIKEPLSILPELFRFLGIRDDIVIDTSKIFNSAEQYCKKSVLRRYSASMINSLISGNKRFGITDNQLQLNKPIRERLQNLFENDIAAVENILDREISIWRKKYMENAKA